jgi:CheY-like chemotaxis protein
MPEALRQVFIVDDDEEIRASLRFLLEDEAYQVEEAVNGMAALAFLEQSDEPWVVLLDRMMPDLDGLEVLRAIAERPQVVARTAIIFLTARQDTFTGEPARLVAAQTFAQVAKPFDLETLLVTIQQACQHLAARSSREAHTS